MDKERGATIVAAETNTNSNTLVTDFIYKFYTSSIRENSVFLVFVNTLYYPYVPNIVAATISICCYYWFSGSRQVYTVLLHNHTALHTVNSDTIILRVTTYVTTIPRHFHIVIQGVPKKNYSSKF